MFNIINIFVVYVNNLTDETNKLKVVPVEQQ